MPMCRTAIFVVCLMFGLSVGLAPRQFSADLTLSAALADDDDDDGGGGGSDDDDDDGGGGGGAGGGGAGSGSSGGAGNDDDDDGGGGGNDDDDDDGNGTDDDDDDGRRGDASGSSAGARTGALDRFAMPRAETDVARQAEISGAGLTSGDLATLRGRGFVVIRSQQLTTFGNTQAVRLRTPPNLPPSQALQVARQIAPGAVFDFSHLFRPGQGNPIYAREMVRISGTPGCGRNLRIGLVDTAVARHASLSNARITRRSFSAGRDDARHGTAVASLLVGRDPAGTVALDGVQLFSASVFSVEGRGLNADAVDIVAALDWLAGQQVRVVNVSITGPANALLATAVTEAARRGMIIVAAGGNGEAGGAPRYPAAYPEVIAVSAIDQRGRPYAFNTRGNYIDVTAPGVDVWAANTRGGGGLWSGTSFAAPFATVTVAKGVSRGEVRNVNDARRMLARTARDLGPRGKDPVFGYGLVQSEGC
jgi:hypothetical protein